MNIYFSSPGQLLRTSQINRLSTTNSQNIKSNQFSSTMFTDWEVTLNIIQIDFSEVEGSDCLVAQQSYDDCILTQFLSLGNNSKFSNLFLTNQSLWPLRMERIPKETIQELYATVIDQDAVSKCSKSCSFFQVQFEQKPRRDFVK